MRKLVIGLCVVAVVVLVVFVGFAAKFVLGGLQSLGVTGAPTYQDVQVTIPHESNPQTLAVFNFRPHGDADAKLYAVGFARALADRLYCAPTGLTQQMTVSEISCNLGAMGLDVRKPTGDAVAVKCGKRMYVSWIVTGDLTLAGGQAQLAVNLTDTHSGKTLAYAADGALGDLPSLQTKLASEIIKGMGLKPTEDQLRAAAQPNFSQAKSLALYGRSFLATDIKGSEALRWQAVDADPGALFPVLRLLEFYHYSGLTAPEMLSNKRFVALFDGVDRQFPADSHVAAIKGLLLLDQGRYADAEALLRKLVEADPTFVRGHTALEYAASCRQDGDLAVAEAQRSVELWPDNACLHARLAGAYTLAANNARRGHYQSDMTWAKRNLWSTSCRRTLEEAATAVKMDRDCEEGWSNLLGVSLQLSRYKDRDTAYNELLRINPKNLSAYKDYAVCFIPQWGGSDADLQRIYSRAEAAFGKDSPDVYSLRASTMLCYPREGRDNEAILRNLDEAIKRCKTPDGDLLLTKSELLLGIRRLDEAQALAEQGVKEWNTPAWQFQLGRCYCIRYEDKGNWQALDKAAKIFKGHVKEVPFAVNGYLQWGWCLSHQGNTAEAKAQFLKGLELDPTNEMLNAKMKYVE